MTEFSGSFSNPESGHDIDPVAVERACKGDRTVSLNRAEVAAAVHHLHHDKGLNFRRIGDLLGISDRTAYRITSGQTDVPQSRPGRAAR